MRIRVNGSDREAVKFPYRDGATPKYRVFPSFRHRIEKGPRNRLQDEVAFADIQHAAEFFVRHPGSAIRVMPGRGIVSQGLMIDIDGQEPEPTNEVVEEEIEGEMT